MSLFQGLLSISASLVFSFTYGIVSLILPQKKYAIKKKGVFILDLLVFSNMAIVFILITQEYGVRNINIIFYTTALVLVSMYFWKVIEYIYMLKKKEVTYLFNTQFDSNEEKIDEYLNEYKSKYKYAVKFKKRVLQIKFIDVDSIEINEIMNVLESKGTFKMKSSKTKIYEITAFTVILCSIFFSFVKFVL